MKKLVTITIFSILFLSEAYSQQGMWVQTGGTPQGSGITDLLYVESTNSLFATTGWYNYPNGDPGGIRRSTDDGETWENVKDAYIARKIIEGADGYLYASVWPYPTAEGFYRSTDNGDTWQALNAVATGNNIFSILVTATGNPYSFFIGTRNWIQRSTDYGNSWTTLNNVGIPPNSWIYDMEETIDNNLIAATSNGVFYSLNNGDTWLQVIGVSSEDTIAHIGLGSEIAAKNNSAGYSLGLGATDGKLFDGDTGAWAVGLADLFIQNGIIKTSDEVHSILEFIFTPSKSQQGINKTESAGHPRLFGVYSQPSQQGGGVVYVIGDTGRFINEGFPSYAPVSIVEIKAQTNNQTLFAGMFENQNGGAKVYKRDFIVSVERENNHTPTKFSLDQNYPNPFNPSTTISFSIPEESFVRLEIFNSIGEKVSTLVSENMVAGNYKYDWNADEYSTGIYFYKITTGNFAETKKMILLK